MSRNANYQFVSTDTEELVTLLVAGYEEITGTTVDPSSPEKLFMQWVANIVLQERVKMNYIGNQNIPSRAEGQNLDALAELFYNLPRPSAKPATCTVRFYISEAQETAILIPQGTRVTDKSSTLFWYTTEDAYIAIGSVSADVHVECITSGNVGNGYAEGQIDTIVDLYDYAESCVNITESGGGSDEATDDEYYELMREAVDSPSTAGARGTYEYYARQVSTEIADVVANSPSDGHVAIYVLMNDGSIASSGLKDEVLLACNDEDVRPLTDYVTVEDADEVEYDINFTYYVPSFTDKSQVQMTADINKAVDDYVAWQNARFGRDINPDKLRELLFACGVKRVVVTSPTFTVLNDGYDNTTPEIAKLGTKTIVNGGYEDE